MSEEETNKRKLWEDNISTFFKDTCPELDYMVLLYLRRRHPHQSSQESELTRAIATERKKAHA